MARTVESRQLLYAFTAAHISPEADVAGLGAVIRTPRRHTVRKAHAAARTTDRVVAAYEAIKLALREAREMGARAIVVYTENEAVLRQLDKTVRVNPEQLARHLETRSLLNQFHRAQVLRASPDNNESAHELAIQAWQEAGGGLLGAPELPLTWVGTGTG
jgi:ribonuclease HI